MDGKKYNRKTKRYARKFPLKRALSYATMDTPILAEVSCSRTWTDSLSQAQDLYNLILQFSQDIGFYQATFSQFKWLSVTIELQPFLSQPTAASDAAVGFFAIRQGVLDIAPSTLSQQNINALDTCFSINNTTRYVRTYKVHQREWCYMNETQVVGSNIPKITAYTTWTTTANTNANLGMMLVKAKCLFKGRIR